MSLRTEDLHARLLEALGPWVTNNSDVGTKPLELDLTHPLPPRLRVYLYNLVDGSGTKRGSEYKISLRVPGQPVGQYDSFDFSDGRFAIMAGYHEDLDVYVLWDSSLHPEFKNGTNVQVRPDTVLEAAKAGFAVQRRRRKKPKSRETVLACKARTLPQTIDRRVRLIGEVVE